MPGIFSGEEIICSFSQVRLLGEHQWIFSGLCPPLITHKGLVSGTWPKNQDNSLLHPPSSTLLLALSQSLILKDLAARQQQNLLLAAWLLQLCPVVGSSAKWWGPNVGGPSSPCAANMSYGTFVTSRASGIGIPQAQRWLGLASKLTYQRHITRQGNAYFVIQMRPLELLPPARWTMLSIGAVAFVVVSYGLVRLSFLWNTFIFL